MNAGSEVGWTRQTDRADAETRREAPEEQEQRRTTDKGRNKERSAVADVTRVDQEPSLSSLLV